MLAQLKGLFTPEAIAASLEEDGVRAVATLEDAGAAVWGPAV